MKDYSYNESHYISKISKAFQLILEDLNEKEINLWAKFRYKRDTDEITEGDFILKNIQNSKNRFKIHKVMFCKTYKRIEVQLSHHKDFETLEFDTLEKQNLSGLEMVDGQEVKMLIRVTADSLTHDLKKECECISEDEKPRDKDGSILTGTRP